MQSAKDWYVADEYHSAYSKICKGTLEAVPIAGLMWLFSSRFPTIHPLYAVLQTPHLLTFFCLLHLQIELNTTNIDYNNPTSKIKMYG